MFKAYTLPAVTFAFRNNICRADRFRGLQELGPYRPPLVGDRPNFGFVFPSEYREQANRLFLALKNGLGYFRGVENAFRFLLRREQVFPVTNFSISRRANPKDIAKIYADAVLSWTQNNREHPDMFFVLHPRTPKWEQETPYYLCKAILLQEGILSQDVTLELLDDSSKLEWSVANIALGAFVKLGGVPWTVSGEEAEDDLIIGVGSAHLFDPQTRQRTRFIGFTTCFSARGLFKFTSLAECAQDRQQYLQSLQNVITTSLKKAAEIGGNVTSLTLHVPKEMGRDEMRAIDAGIRAYPSQYFPQVSVLKVTDEAQIFAVDETSTEGVPPRGTVIKVSDEDYILYTEGREEKLSWRYRLPSALRITPQDSYSSSQRVTEAIRQVYDLSHVNWRGFNAQSRPISILYSSLIADILSHVPSTQVGNLYKAEARKILEERMWFL
jgi:Piwi domain